MIAGDVCLFWLPTGTMLGCWCAAKGLHTCAHVCLRELWANVLTQAAPATLSCQAWLRPNRQINLGARQSGSAVCDQKKFRIHFCLREDMTEAFKRNGFVYSSIVIHPFSNPFMGHRVAPACPCYCWADPGQIANLLQGQYDEKLNFLNAFSIWNRLQIKYATLSLAMSLNFS